VEVGERGGDARRVRERVPEQREATARAQHLGRLVRAEDRVHPVPGRTGDDEVEDPTGRLPALERRDLDLEPGAAGDLGHALVGFDAEHPTSGVGERPGGDAGADADVEDGASGARREDRVDHLVGIARRGSIVPLGRTPQAFGDR
jgi:hypothetical protein